MCVCVCVCVCLCVCTPYASAVGTVGYRWADSFCQPGKCLEDEKQNEARSTFMTLIRSRVPLVLTWTPTTYVNKLPFGLLLKVLGLYFVYLGGLRMGPWRPHQNIAAY